MTCAKLPWPAALLPAVFLLAAAGSLHAQQAGRRLAVIQPAVAAIMPIVVAPSGAAIVDKLLRPGPSDPDVPLPRSDLADERVRSESLDRPRIFGRQEDRGGVLGVRIPFPAARKAAVPDTRYSAATRPLGAP